MKLFGLISKPFERDFQFEFIRRSQLINLSFSTIPKQNTNILIICFIVATISPFYQLKNRNDYEHN